MLITELQSLRPVRVSAGQNQKSRLGVSPPWRLIDFISATFREIGSIVKH
jgi:hypothetical protein